MPPGRGDASADRDRERGDTAPLADITAATGHSHADGHTSAGLPDAQSAADADTSGCADLRANASR
jgi:hypothetical protein